MPMPPGLAKRIADIVGLYILDANHQVVEVDLETWADWYENFDNRRVAYTETPRFEISTVFLANGRQRDQLFETMLHDKPKKIGNPLTFWRYATWDEAVAGHAATVASCRDIEEAEDL